MTLSKCALGIAALIFGVGVAGANATVIDGAIYFGGGATNFYDPAQGYVPSGYDNATSPSITVPGVFGFQDVANLDTAAFTSTSLKIEDVTYKNAVNWTQTFTADTAGFFSNLQLVSDSFPSGVTYSVAGNTLTVNWGGTSSTGDAVAMFSFGGAVPEPSTWAMMTLGFAGLGFAGWRARRSGVAAA